ncbi:MAG: hypothetical protein KGS61_20770 [Verrucomicrobia bacterium]|nr:hypothetical protein [Verrucomicrobiota bacterium]
MQPPVKCLCCRILWSCLFLLFVVPRLGIAETAPPVIHVILWFDTEDYLLPASDDAAKRLAQMLTQRGIHATFKVVGEKARTLQRRGRQDVIAALKQHAIGYHANFHSVHPTPAEYLEDCGLLDGIAEFVRREGGGAGDVRRIFGVGTLACYGQPGSSWAAPAIAALKTIGVAPHGVPCYVDDGSQVGVQNKPFWYENALMAYDLGPNVTRMDLHDPQGVQPAERKFQRIAERLAHDGGGLVSIYFHPCEWVHRQFWDAVNFSHGANPPRERWRPPPQLPPEETEAAFDRFGQYIDFIRARPGVHFVTANDLPEIYPDSVRSVGVAETVLDELARRLIAEGARGVDFQVIGRQAISAADQFELFARVVGSWITGNAPQFPLRAAGLLGPDAAPPVGPAPVAVDWPAFRDATLDVMDFVQTQRRVPARVFLGAYPVPPTDFLVGLARAYEFRRRQGRLPTGSGVPLGNHLELLPARHVAADTQDVFGWVIHRPGFRGQNILALARLQTWTLKPALGVSP